MIEHGHTLNRVSDNIKTGPIPVSTHTRKTCPSACPLNHKNEGGCYANNGPLSWYWNNVTSGQNKKGKKIGDSWSQFIEDIKKLPNNQLWRYAQAGDLVGEDNTIDSIRLRQLIKANKRKKGFTYTHKPLTRDNLKAIKEANNNGFIINISANNKHEAVRIFQEHKLPTVTLLPLSAPNVQEVDGVKIVACPHEKNKEKIKCSNCQLCAIRDRDYIIGFRPHGTGKKKANLIAMREAS